MNLRTQCDMCRASCSTPLQIGEVAQLPTSFRHLHDLHDTRHVCGECARRISALLHGALRDDMAKLDGLLAVEEESGGS